MRMHQRSRLALAAGLTGLMLMATVMVYVVHAATVNIDTFNDGDGSGGPRVVCDGPGPPNQNLCYILPFSSSDSTDIAVGVLGGERDMRVTKTAGNGDMFLWTNQANAGLLTLNVDTATQGVAEVVWDGNDDDPTNINTSLLSVDLVNGPIGPNDSFLVQSVSDDQPSAIILEVYCSATDYSQSSVSLPGGIGIGSVVDFILPFSTFTTAGGTGCDPANTNVTPARAIRLLIDGTISDGTDLTIDLIEATGGRDFGDAPDTYSTTLSSNGARHVPLGLRLGTSIDTEADGPALGDGTNDDTLSTPDDEDGVLRDMNDTWQNNASVDLLVTVNGCTSPPCYLNGWIDWEGDTNFLDAGDQIFSNRPIFNGPSQSIAITVPDVVSYTVGSPVYARFRICPATSGPGNCSTFAGETTNGEVEDYYWEFTPTAVSLRDAGASGQSTLVPVSLAGLFVLALVTVGLYGNHRRRLHRLGIG